ncbi:MAG: hypothetical protein IH851_02950 [Armatimonadetes bacterium]|nr:hypothetical protein [Armatimonadota bacterium]
MKETVSVRYLDQRPDSIRDWAALEGASEWREALATAPYVEARGNLYFSLLEANGGYFEHLPAPGWDIVTRLVQRSVPVHQRYRWYPPLGSAMFNGHNLSESIMGFLLKKSYDPKNYPKWRELIKALGYDILDQGCQFIGLVLPSGERILLVIGLPTENDHRFERIPWLHAVVHPPFEDTPKECLPAVHEAWEGAWSDHDPTL